MYRHGIRNAIQGVYSIGLHYMHDVCILVSMIKLCKRHETEIETQVHSPGTAEIPFLLKLEKVAFQLSVSVRTVRRLIEAGELAEVKVGRSIRVPAHSVAIWVASQYPARDNPTCAGPSMETTEMEVRKPCYTDAQKNRGTGTPITRTQQANASAALRALLSERKRKRC